MILIGLVMHCHTVHWNEWSLIPWQGSFIFLWIVWRETFRISLPHGLEPKPQLFYPTVDLIMLFSIHVSDKPRCHHLHGLHKICLFLLADIQPGGAAGIPVRIMHAVRGRYGSHVNPLWEATVIRTSRGIKWECLTVYALQQELRPMFLMYLANHANTLISPFQQALPSTSYVCHHESSSRKDSAYAI